MFHSYETEKITRKASDAAEYIGLVRFFRPSSSFTTHSLNVRRYLHRALLHYEQFDEIAGFLPHHWLYE